MRSWEWNRPKYFEKSSRGSAEPCSELVVCFDAALEPGSGVCPLSIGRGARKAEYFGGVGNGETGKKVELNKLCGLLILGGEAIEGIVDRQEPVVGERSGRVGVVQFDTCELAAVLSAGLAACGFDKNAAHGFSGGGEEVAAVVPMVVAVVADEAKVGFVDERGGLQRVAGAFVGHTGAGEPPQLIVDEWE